MKTRIDFVSNSSSCSFMIADACAGVEMLKDIGIFDEMTIGISARFSLSIDDFAKINMPKLKDWTSEDAVYCSCTPLQLLQLPKQVLECIKDLELTCEDFERQDVFILTLLYEVLKMKGIDVTDENSEMSFLDNENVAFKLLNYISKGKQE